ncbi:MAG: hypothetical protein ABSG15_05080 [FCB group bacterium]|jgi:hypothetical protein
MKNIIMAFAATMLIFLQVKGQDITDPPKLSINFNNASIFDRNYNQTHVMRAWNWSGPGKKLDDALLMNSYHDICIACNDSDFANDLRIIFVLKQNWDGIISRVSYHPFNGLALHLEPTINVDSNDFTFQPRAGDSTGAVFGFYGRDFVVGDTTTDFKRFILHSDIQTTYPRVVLNNIWNGTILRYEDYQGTNDTSHLQNRGLNSNYDKTVYHPFNGKQYYLSINLKTINWDSLQQHLNDTLLKIRLPYQQTRIDTNSQGQPIDTVISYSYVKFDYLPYQSETHNKPIYGTINTNYRGIYRELDTISPQTQDFYITGRMLKNDTLDHNITLSAFAFFDGIPFGGGFLHNPVFKNDWWANTYKIMTYISKIDVEVNYYGIVDLGIDWIRLETPRMRDIYFGKYDSLAYAICDSNVTDFQSHIQKRQPRIFRFYLADEAIPMQWSSVRYLNMLLDTLGELETPTYNPGHQDSPPAHYIYATGQEQNRNGSILDFGSRAGVPFYKKTRCIDPNKEYTQTSSFNLRYGFNGNNLHSFNDTLNSEYESHLRNTMSIPVTGGFNIFDDFENIRGTLFNVEFNSWNGYGKYPAILFSSKPWWSNLWIQSESWIKDTSIINSFTLINTSNRPKTGEEVRLLISEPVILGAKGLFYYLKTRYGYLSDSTDIGSLGLQNNINPNVQNSLPTGDSLVYNNFIGGDYINYLDTNYKWNNYFNPNVYDLNFMKVDTGHFYIGLRSTRAEIMKNHKWIDAVQNELMNLKLMAWYAYGFKNWYVQDPTIPIPNILQNYVYLNLMSRHPGWVNQFGNPIYEA